MCNSRCSK